MSGGGIRRTGNGRDWPVHHDYPKKSWDLGERVRGSVSGMLLGRFVKVETVIVGRSSKKVTGVYPVMRYVKA